MTNEATVIEAPTIIHRYTCADGNAIPYGTLLKLTSPCTVAATSADNDAFAGIANEEKTASDGVVTIAVAKNGKWNLYGGAAITVGERVSIGGANTVTKVAAADLLFADVGVAETTTGGAGTVVVRVNAL
jgi:hypothetical protein